jgi:hypothetical protein
MLLTKAVLDGIVEGRINRVFRRWQKPTVKSGGTLRTVVGMLNVHSVELIDQTQITDAEAIQAGFTNAEDLLTDLFRERPNSSRGARSEGERSLYRITVTFAGPDTRIGLRADDQLTDDELASLLAKLTGFDNRSASGPWTLRVLSLIDNWPGRRAPELAEMEGKETLPFKNDVRKLKTLGLTESLPVGYRISPRGQRVLTVLRSRDGTVG